MPIFDALGWFRVRGCRARFVLVSFHEEFLAALDEFVFGSKLTLGPRKNLLPQLTLMIPHLPTIQSMFFRTTQRLQRSLQIISLMVTQVLLPALNRQSLFIYIGHSPNQVQFISLMHMNFSLVDDAFSLFQFLQELECLFGVLDQSDVDEGFGVLFHSVHGDFVIVRSVLLSPRNCTLRPPDI